MRSNNRPIKTNTDQYRQPYSPNTGTGSNSNNTYNRPNDGPVGENRAYTCEICREEFSDPLALGRHVRTCRARHKRQPTEGEGVKGEQDAYLQTLEEERKRLAKENALLKEEINQLRLAARAQSLGPNPATPTLGRLTGIQHPDPLTGAGILQLTTSISEYFDRKREMLENPKPQVNQEVMARLERLETRLEALTQPKVDPRDEQIKELQTRITELKESLQRKEVEELKSKILALEKRVEESKSRPQHAYREDLYALGDKLLTSLEKRRPAEALVAALAPYSPYYRGKPSKVEEPEASKHDTLMNFLSRNAPELIG